MGVGACSPCLDSFLSLMAELGKGHRFASEDRASFHAWPVLRQDEPN